jgi:oxepin-CoA hydrolase/3-oxo-5,6-dehydrosuberyl-CoA semialdehyde dehydrogenase
MQTLSSYVLGRWHEGDGDPATLVNPSTEEPIACCSTGGIDFGAVVQHAREAGGPALRAVGFQERGRWLKALAGAIHEHREELIDLSIQNGGGTRGDAKFDVDGATGTLAYYASMSKGLPEGNLLPDGEGLQLGRTPRFWGRHVRVPRPGVAVHVNAFNFPAWGMCEKLACALLAGVPCIEKPGTPTALVAWRVAKAIVESGVLPEGAFQFLCGRTGDLLDHLGAQDHLAFTGSSGTGALLKGTQALISRNARVNIEADSLNCAIVAPDLESDSETYGTLLENLRIDVTQKTGQKCTAVRRVLVPADRVQEIVDEVVAVLSRTTVGDPTEDGVTMGALSSAQQLEDVRSGIARLSEVCDVACGGADPVREKGYFVAPTLLVARDAEADVLHELEVFGPVTTVIPYSGEAAEAARLANRGGGCLVSSVYSNDKAWTAEVVQAIAPWHGRVFLASDRVAGQATAPGLVLPATIHGGPGRAGGGEELGGRLGLEFYTQRTAVQGFQGLVDAIAAE